MKALDPRLWLSIFTLLVVLLLVVRDVRQKKSPGELSVSHGAVAELNGPQGCALCHGVDGVELQSACRECHADLARQLEAGLGLHGSLEGSLLAACGSCHVEHFGSELALVGDLAFAKAGVEEVAAFDHGHVRFELDGVHADLGCEVCHPNARATLLIAGERRFLGVSQRCASCHEDPHEGKYEQDCASCHGQLQPFAELESFVHTAELPLVGAHGELACDDCHAPASAHSIEALAGAGEKPRARACLDCHDSPHELEFLAQIAAEVSAQVSASCALCHDALHSSFAEGFSLSVQQHAASGFALELPHADLECAACHGDGFEAGADFAARHPGRSADSCESCHTDAHGGQFAAGAFADATCSTCHDSGAFRPHAFTARLHAYSAFPLEPAHEPVPCADCHQPPERPEELLHFAQASTRCDDCHRDAHAGGIIGQGAAGCAECHRATRFDEVVRQAFDHDARTRFALEGAHALAECEACHVPESSIDELGRVFGRITAAFAGQGPGDGCASCHDDVHRGAFDGIDAADCPVQVEGRVGCARCHSTSTFQELSSAHFEHGVWSGFELEGAHDAIACQSCHGLSPEASPRSLGLVVERYGRQVKDCGDCHDDPHAGRFDREGLPSRVAQQQSCARCHGTEAFDAGARGQFEHQLWTGYALEGVHAQARCEDCHVLRRPELGLGATRGDGCSDCHADPHVGQFVVQGATDCARCHQGSQAFSEVIFDHQTQSRFALDEQHAQIDCDACHRPWPLPGGGEVVRYKPLGLVCTDCHASGDEGGGR